MIMHEGIIGLLVGLLAAAPGFVRAEESSSATPSNAAVKAKLSDDELGDLLRQATSFARVGLYDEAVTRCRQILEQNPGQPTVKELLLEIQAQRAQINRAVPGAQLKQELSGLIIAELNVRDAAVADVIEFLRDESRRLTAGKGEINFVWQVPPGQTLPKVTLNLRNVPMLDIIQYVTTLARLSYRVDARAVVIYVSGPPSTFPVSPAPAGLNVKPQ